MYGGYSGLGGGYSSYGGLGSSYSGYGGLGSSYGGMGGNYGSYSQSRLNPCTFFTTQKQLQMKRDKKKEMEILITQETLVSPRVDSDGL